MKRATIRAALGALFAAAVCFPSAAEQGAPDDPYARNGFFLALTGNYQRENYGGTNGFAPDSSGGVSGRVGYRLHRFVSVGIETAWVKDALEDTFNESAFVVTANVKAYLPLKRFQPFLLVGPGFIRAPVPDDANRKIQLQNGMAFRLGGGLDLYATENWALTLQASYVQPLPINRLEQVPFTSLAGGIEYRF